MNAIREQVSLQARYIMTADYAFLLSHKKSQMNKFIFLLRPISQAEGENNQDVIDLRKLIEDKNETTREEITEAI